jgi:hypothetical protein
MTGRRVLGQKVVVISRIMLIARDLETNLRLLANWGGGSVLIYISPRGGGGEGDSPLSSQEEKS